MFGTHRYQSDLRKLVGYWIEFRDLVQTHLGDEAVTQLTERRFLDLKGLIAEALARLGEGLPAQHAAEATGAQRGMIEFMNSVPSLREGGVPTAEKRDAFERTWQRYFLHLNQFKGLKAAHARSGAARPPIPDPSRRSRRPLEAFFGNWFVKFVLVVAVLTGAVWVLARILPWERMGFGPGLAGLGGAAGGAVRSGGRFIERNSAGLGGLPARIADFFQPVVAQYGPEVTAIMCTVLLLAFGYWAFIRMR